jgi:hypothetical protein
LADIIMEAVRGLFSTVFVGRRKVPMNKKRGRIFLFVLLVVFAGLQAGCGPGKSAALKAGLRMTGRMMEKFTDFDGVEGCRITAGRG